MSTVQVIKARKLEAGSGEKNAPQLRVVSGVKTLRSCKGKTIGRITGISESEGRDKDNYRTTFIRRNLNMKSTDESITASEIPLPNTTKRFKSVGVTIDVYYNPDKPQENYDKGTGDAGLGRCGDVPRCNLNRLHIYFSGAL